MTDALQTLGAHIAASLPGAVSGFDVAYGELNVHAEAADIVKVLTFLQSDAKCQFWNIVDVCGADYPGRENRFDVVYHLLSPRLVQRIRVKVQADETTPVPSVTGLFPGADWFEREAYDIYGILFTATHVLAAL